MYAHRGKKVQLFLFLDHQEMNAILLIIGIVYGVCEKWYNKLFNVKYLPLFHHFKAIYQFPKHNFFGQNRS